MKRWILGVVLIFGSSICASAQGSNFFSTPSTWTTPIPPGHPISTNSREYVDFLTTGGSGIAVSRGEWSVPICYWEPGDPIVANMTLTLSDTSSTRAVIEANGWDHDVPMPDECFPAGYGRTDYRDRHLAIIRRDLERAWEFFGLRDDKRTTSRVLQWNLTGDGINQPYNGASVRVAPVPLLSNLITFDEIQAGVIPHALGLCFNAAFDLGPPRQHGGAKAGSPGVYPAVSPNSGLSEAEWAPWLGMRFQLDPAVDVATLGLSTTGKIIAKALQDYGMMMIENCGVDGASVYAESLDYDGTRSWGSTFNSLGLSWSTLSPHLRLVEPVYPSQGANSLRLAPPANPRVVAVSSGQE